MGAHTHTPEQAVCAYSISNTAVSRYSTVGLGLSRIAHRAWGMRHAHGPPGTFYSNTRNEQVKILKLFSCHSNLLGY
jgi:hypothetical protein